MCTDCKSINNITVKYRHPILRLDDRLDELHGATLFSKIDLKFFFLGFMVRNDGVYVDFGKIKAIQEWPTATIVGEHRNFHGLGGFYRRFV